MFLLILLFSVISILLISLIIFFNSIFVVKQAEVIIVESFGKFNRVLQPGLHILNPIADRPRFVEWSFFERSTGLQYRKSFYRIDLRETVDQFSKQNVITKDNVTMEISALLYYQIFDPKLALYEVLNLPEAIEKLTQTTLRNIIGSMDLDETLVSRDKINTKLRIILDDATHKWGVKVNRVELQEVNPPFDIRQAMEKQMRAERDRRAIILEAEGKKRATILEAEGDRESAILSAEGHAKSRIIDAEGEATSRIMIAQAEAEAIEKIKTALSKSDPVNYMIAMQYIKILPEMTKGKDDKLIVVPYEISGIISSIASIKKIFEETK